MEEGKKKKDRDRDEREIKNSERKLMGNVMLFSTSDNVRTRSVIEEDRLKAEVAAGREGQECCFEPHTLTRIPGHCSMLAV